MKKVTTYLFILVFVNSCSSDEKVELNDAGVEEAPGKDSENKGYIPEGYTKIWEDNFYGSSIDTSNWVVASLRDPETGDLVPGATGDYLLNTNYAGYITEEDTYIEDSCLVLRNQKRLYQGTNPEGTYNYTSGWVMSMHRVSFNKGYLEIRAKFPSGDKVWPAAWLIAEDLVWGPEWDMWEYFGYNSEEDGEDLMGCHLCYGEYPNTMWSSYFIQDFDEIYDSESWHIYGFQWCSNHARWYIDGEIVRTLPSTDIPDWPNEAMYIVLNNGQKEASPDNDSNWPNYFIIDYVALYKKEE